MSCLRESACHHLVPLFSSKFIYAASFRHNFTSSWCCSTNHLAIAAGGHLSFAQKMATCLQTLANCLQSGGKLGSSDLKVKVAPFETASSKAQLLCVLFALHFFILKFHYCSARSWRQIGDLSCKLWAIMGICY